MNENAMNPVLINGTPHDSDAVLEDVIDANGLTPVLELLVIVCLNKASHITDTYQDTELANRWLKAGDLLDALATKVHAKLDL